MRSFNLECLGELILQINERKSYIFSKLKSRDMSIIDAFHGEMNFTMHPNVQTKLLDFTRRILSESADLSEEDGRLYSKSQPKILRQLAAQKLFHRFAKVGFHIDINEVLVCPYSSLVMLEAAISTIAKPNGLILCPTGFYKSNALHIEKFGLKLQVFPADIDQDARIDPNQLQLAIQLHRADLCGILLTLPGNPFVAEYSAEELQAIGQVIVE